MINEKCVTHFIPVCDWVRILHAVYDEVRHWHATITGFFTENFRSPTMRRDVNAYLRSCQSHQLVGPNVKLDTGALQLVLGLFHAFSLDFERTITGNKNNGNRNILIAVNYLTGRQ